MMIERFILMCSLVGVLCVETSYGENIDSVIVTQTPSNVPVIGSTTGYTITCDVTVSCTAPCNDTLTISWSLNGNNINSNSLTESNSSFTVLNSGTFTSTLTTVGDISLSHAGQYQCTASLTTSGIHVSNTTNFDMKLPAPSITVTNDTVADNSTATLVCLSSISDISVSFVYEWTGPDNLVISGETDGTLIISSVGVDDAGQYMCRSTASYTGNEVDAIYIIESMNTASVYLTVRDIDSVLVTQTPSNVPVIGSTIEYTINCVVTVSFTGPCNDTITISWSLKGNIINSATLTESNNSPFTVSSGGTFSSTLNTVGDICLSHAGEYQCTASLITGISNSNTTDFDVKLPGPSVSVTNDTVADDSTATLVCLSSISDISVSFVYEWTGPNNLVKSGGTDGTLIVSSVGVDDAGQYMCTSTASYTGNEVDSKHVIDSRNTASVYLAIEDIDSVMVTQTPSTVPAIGSTTEYTITCDVSVSCTGPCNDTLTISWSLNGNSINSTTLTDSNNSPFSVSSSGTFTSTLTTVGDIHLSHAGEYQCITSLITAGISDTNTTDFDVKFQTPTVEVTNTTVSSGEDAILTCIVATVNNNPEDLTSNITWSPDTGTAGATLRTNIIFLSIYTISNVDDDGIYTCKATLSHTSEYVLRSDSESGQGYVSITEPTKNDENVVIVLSVILAIVLIALIIIITVFICFLMRVRSSKHGIRVATDDNELQLQDVDSENEEIGKDVEITDKDPIDVTPLLPGSPSPEDIPVQ